jgi:hypothetical protein
LKISVGKAGPTVCLSQAKRISQIERIPAGICIGVDPARKADGVALDIAARPWVVVALIIVMQFCDLIKEMPRKAELVDEGARRGAIAEGGRASMAFKPSWRAPADAANGMSDWPGGSAAIPACGLLSALETFRPRLP